MSNSNAGQGQRRDTLGYVLRLVNQFLQGQRWLFLMALVMLIAEAAMSIFESYPLAYLIDYLQGNRPDLVTYLNLPVSGSPLIITVALLTLSIVLMAMINSLGDSLAEIYLARGGRMLGYNLRTALYTHLQRLSLAFHDQRRTGDILTRVTGDVSEVENFVMGSLSDIVGSLLVLFGTLAFLTYHSWQVALVGVAIVPIMAFVSNYFSQRIKAAAKKQRAREGDLASATQEMLTSIRVIQTYSRHAHDLTRFADYNQKNAEAALLAARLQAIFSWVVRVLEALAISVVVWLGLWLINRSAITVGMLLMFIVLIQNVFKPTRKIIKEWNTISKIFASVERIGELLDRKPAVIDAPDAIVAPAFQGHIEFQTVSFTYRSDLAEQEPEVGDAIVRRQALQAVSFRVAPGEVMALVGHTGAGKSTIVQLLPRLYDPSHGCIQIDGQDIRRFTLESLRNQISVVLQETILFNGTVAENIAFGRTDATRDEIVEAALQANAHEFIAKLPEGYDTLLGERGANLSGGQRQRLAIARAFIRSTPILILDEPTTGLDAQSAELVLLALRSLMKGKTTIIISHDLKLIRQADKIVVLKEGQIEAMGTHQELLKAKGGYASIYTQHFGLAEPAEEQPASPYDLLRSPALQQKWPHIITAFDAATMQTQLQNALFAPASSCTITRCKPGKATYLGGDGCLLRYDLTVTDNSSGQSWQPLVLARVFAQRSLAESYLRERLTPLVDKMAGRPELAPFAHPVAVLAALNMVVHVSPIDGELPTLVAATDPDQMRPVFQQLLPAGLEQDFTVEQCAAEVGHYGRQHRCVLRYEVSGQWTSTHKAGRLVVYGKLAADDRGALVEPVLKALHLHQMNNYKAYWFTLPRALGYQPDLRLVLLEAIPGKAQFTQLLKQYVHEQGYAVNPDAEEGLELEEALEAAARVIATLHTSNIMLGQPRALSDEFAELEQQLLPVWQLSPTLAMQFQDALKRVKSYAADTELLPFCFSHGDYTHTQLLFDDSTCGLVDFDTVCQAEPALDLGHFQAYLRLATYKAQGEPSLHQEVVHENMTQMADALSHQFLTAYLEAAEVPPALTEQLRTRLPVYEIISLLRLALHSWQKLKESRLEQTLAILEERLACLPMSNPTNTPTLAPIPSGPTGGNGHHLVGLKTL